MVAPAAAQVGSELNVRLDQRREPQQLIGLAGGAAGSSSQAGKAHLWEANDEK